MKVSLFRNPFTLAYFLFIGGPPAPSNPDAPTPSQRAHFSKNPNPIL